MKKIKTFADACLKVGVSENHLPDVSKCMSDLQAATLAHYKLMIIAKALNDGWEPDWSDYNQTKYTVWNEIKATVKKKGGVGFSHVGYDRWHTYSGVSSRLCFRDSDTALYAGKQFKQLFIDYFIIQ